MAEKTTSGRLVAAVGGIVLIISLFFKWYGISFGGEFGQIANQFANSINVDTSVSGWQSLDFGDIVFLVVGLLAIAPAALDIFDLEVDLPFDVAFVALIGGAISAAWIVLRMIDKPDGAGLKIGIFLGLAGAVVVAVGGFLQKSDSGEDAFSYAAPGQPGQAVPPQAPPQQPPAAPTPPQDPPQPPPPPPPAPPAV